MSEPKAFQFPDLPTAPPNVFEKKFRDLGLPPNAAWFRHALDSGVSRLADQLLSTSSSDIRRTPFDLPGKREEILGRVISILHGVTKKFIIILLEGRTHELHSSNVPPGLVIVRDNRLVLPNDEGNRPQIYILTLCSASGGTPTKRQLLEAIKIMRDYVCRSWSDAGRTAIDAVAWEFDNHSPSWRDWEAMTFRI